jgi:hypothetical protein
MSTEDRLAVAFLIASVAAGIAHLHRLHRRRALRRRVVREVGRP